MEPIQPFPTPAGRPRDLGLSRGLVRRMSHLYAAEVTLVDRWLGRLLARLAQLGMDDNTLVVAISDHGVLLGEYGWVGKRYKEMHQPLCHVPFAMRHPAGQGQGTRVPVLRLHPRRGPHGPGRARLRPPRTR